MGVSAVVLQLQRIQQLERVVDWDATDLGSPIFDVIDALFGHIVFEEWILEGLREPTLEDASVRVQAEWERHRIHHTRARLACFRLVTCEAGDRKVRADELRAILREHAKHEMLVVGAMRVAAESQDDGPPIAPLGTGSV